VQRRERLIGPGLELVVPAALAIALEQRDRVLMGADLIIHVLLCEIVALEALQLIEHALLRACHLGWQGNLQLWRQSLKFAGRLGVVGDHLIGERLDVALGPLGGELARLDLEHIAGRCLFDEIRGLRRNTEGGIDPSLLADRLRKGRPGDEQTKTKQQNLPHDHFLCVCWPTNVGCCRGISSRTGDGSVGVALRVLSRLCGRPKSEAVVPKQSLRRG